MKIDGKAHYLGTYETSEEAHSAYRVAKKMNVRRMAEVYRAVLDARVYTNLMNYEIEL